MASTHKREKGKGRSEVGKKSARLNVEASLTEGDKFMVEKDWVTAHEMYTSCIVQCQRRLEICSNLLLKDIANVEAGFPLETGGNVFDDYIRTQSYIAQALSSRSQIFLEEKMYGSALSDAEQALDFDSSHWQTLSRKAVALRGLARYEEASMCFTNACDLGPGSEDQALLVHAADQCKVALQQSRTGHYNLADYFLSGAMLPEPIFGEYVGAVEIRMVPESGRGLVLKEGATRGQILIVSNRLAKAQRVRIHRVGPEAVKASLAVLQELAGQLFVKVNDSVRVRDQVYSLDYEQCCCSDLEVPSMSLFRNDSEAVRETRRNLTTELDRMFKVVVKNALNEVLTDGTHEDPSSGLTQLKVDDWGIWALPSFINHSCFPNCTRLIIGDAMFVIACKDIEASEELTMPYFDIFQPLIVRTEATSKWGFSCGCPRCQFECTLGTPYKKIQKAIIDITSKLSFWFMNRASDPTMFAHDIDTQLKALTLQLAPIEAMVKGSSSDDKDNDWFLKHMWIRGSTIDALLADHALLSKSAVRANDNVVNGMRLVATVCKHVYPGSGLGLAYFERLLPPFLLTKKDVAACNQIAEDCLLMCEAFYGKHDKDVLWKLFFRGMKRRISLDSHLAQPFPTWQPR